MLKWFTIVQTIDGNERYVSFPVHFRWNLRREIYPEKNLLDQTFRRENSEGVRSVELGRLSCSCDQIYQKSSDLSPPIFNKIFSATTLVINTKIYLAVSFPNFLAAEKIDEFKGFE